MDEKRIKVCPRCGSTDITFDGAGFVHDVCGNCGFGKRNMPTPHRKILFDNFPEIKESDLDKFRKHIKKNPIVKW